MMTEWTSEYIRMVKDCEKKESQLNEWEAGFISSLRTTLERGKTITIKQTEKLEKIWLRVT